MRNLKFLVLTIVFTTLFTNPGTFYAQSQTRLPEIYSIEIRNVTYDGDIITDFGEKIYSSETMYLKPRIRYKSYADRNYTFDIKWINPDGSLSRGSSSPSRYSQSETYTLYSGESNKLLRGWGSKTKGNWEAGDYAIEIWCNGTLLKRKEFTIYRRSSSSSTKSRSSSSGHYETCFNCGGSGFLTLFSPYGSYTTYCPGCGGSGRIYIPEIKTNIDWNSVPINTYSGGSVPINTYSGGYDNNNTNNNTNSNSGQKTCSFCGGTGWITNDDAPDFTGGTKWCSRCNKEVRMSHSHEKCPSCGGTGKSW